MNEQEQKEFALRQLNLAWKLMHEAMQRGSMERLFDNSHIDFPPCPVGDPDAEELQRIFELESPN